MFYYKCLIDALCMQATEAATAYALAQKGDDDENGFAAKQVKIIENTLPKLLALETKWIGVDEEEAEEEEKIYNWGDFDTQFKKILTDAELEGSTALRAEASAHKLNLDYLQRYTSALRNIKKQLDALFTDEAYTPHHDKDAKDYTSLSVEQSSLINQFLHLLMMYRIEKWVHFTLVKPKEPSDTSGKKFQALEGTFKAWNELLQKGVEGRALDTNVNSLLKDLIGSEKTAQSQSDKRGAFFGYLKTGVTALANYAGANLGGILGPKLLEFKKTFDRCRPYDGHEADKLDSRAHSPF